MSGYFDNNKNEYVITEMFPRRELLNYLWNETTVCLCNQFGGGNAWTSFGKARRQIEKGERNVYIKDLTTGEYYSANRNYGRLPFDVFQCRVGLGYHTVENSYKGLFVCFELLVPTEGNVVQYRVTLKNETDENKELDVYFCNQPQADLSGHESYGDADYDEEMCGLDFAHEGFAVSSEYTHVYLASEKKPLAYATSKNSFCGVYGSFENPDALKADTLSCEGAHFEMNHVGALQYRLSLQAGEEWSVALACGIATNKEECVELAHLYATQTAFENGLQCQYLKNREYLDVYHLDSPDAYLNVQANVWLKRQLSLGKTWGRLYGKGFRDVMQDITAFISFDVSFAKERILQVLKHQYEDGNPIRMFEPDMMYPYNDGGVWIPAAVLAYLNESGDLTILEEQIPYLKGMSAEKMGYGIPTAFHPYDGTETTDSVFNHVKRAMDYLYDCRGSRGLVLFRGGDWNDSLNNAGRLGKGESVWLTIATVKAYNEFIEILRLYGCEELIEEYEMKKTELAHNVLKYGVDGDHLLYGFNDYDEKIGSDENEYAKIFLNPQTWAVLADLTDKETLEKFMDTVENRLKCDYGYLQCYPSYRKGTDRIGRISYFQPGLVENGAVYNHGVAFKVVADCILGRGDNAYASLKAISYDNPKNPDNGVEPYAVSNMYMGPENPHIAGYAPMSWITGTAGWLYRCITEYLCGVQPTMNGLKICPCLPTQWDKITLTRKFRGAIYEIEMLRSNEDKIWMDGKEIEGNILPICESGKREKVTVYYK